MRKIFFIISFFALTTLCFSQSRYYVSPGLQKLFFNFNMMGDYEKFSLKDSNFYIKSNNALLEIALGYDFGIIVPRIYLDIGFPINGEVGFTDSKENLTGYMKTKNTKFGLETGIKPVKTERFELIIPLGALFCGTTYTQKDPSYISGTPYDRIWDYSYINLYSGINATIKLNNHFKLGFFSRYGIPVKKEMVYKEVLRGNYIWTSTNSKTYSKKYDIDVSALSIGIGILANL